MQLNSVLGRQIEMTERRTQRVDYKLRVHTVPEDLPPPVVGREHLTEASAVYRMAVESTSLWDVWLVDEFGASDRGVV